MSEPVLSRAVISRLRAPEEVQLAQRILSSVAATVESRVDRAAAAAAAREDTANAAKIAAEEAASAERKKRLGGERPLEHRPEVLLAARELRAMRSDFKRFSDFYRSGHLLPISIFMEAVQLSEVEKLQRRTHRFSAETFKYRAELLKEYLRLKRALFLLPPPKRRRSFDAERAESGVSTFKLNGSAASSQCELVDPRRAEAEIIQKSSLVVFWNRFEKQFLREKEEHAVAALRPLVACITAAEALLRSCNRELILAEPAASQQRICTYRALQCFCTSVAHLSQDLLSVYNTFTFLEAQSVVFAAAVVAASEAEAAVPLKASGSKVSSLFKQTRTSCDEKAMDTPSSDSRSARDDFEASRRSGALQGGDAERNFQNVGFASTSETGNQVWRVLNLVALSDEAGLSSDEVIMQAANKAALSAAQRVVTSFFALLDFIWQSRECLSHINANLEFGAPYLQSALLNFERSHWQFQRLCCRPYCLV